MEDYVDISLRKVAKGTFLIFLGMFIGKFLAFVAKLLIINGTEPWEFGLISLAIAIISIFIRISALGLPTGVVRNIPFYKAKNDLKGVWGVIVSSTQIIILSSIACSLLLFFFSDQISHLFTLEEPDLTSKLSSILQILAIALPFCIITNLLISIIRGFENVKAKVYFEDILPPVIRTILFAIVIFSALGLFGFVFAYLISFILVGIFAIFYTLREIPELIKKREYVPMKMELLKFSIPLLGVGVMGMIMNWADTLMLGYFKEKELVGLYNAVTPLAQVLSMFLGAMIFIYIPVATSFYSKNMHKEMKRMYAIVTKWAFALALPIILVLLLFPDNTLRFFFGQRYVTLHTIQALQILVIGFGISNFLGPNGHTLIVIGRTKLVMFNNIISAMLNLILNIILIPTWDLIGAAVATSSSLILLNLLASSELYIISKIHPFTKNYLKPVIISVILIFIISTIARGLRLFEYNWILPILFVIFLAVYGFSILSTKSFDKEDIMILKSVEKRSGIDATPIKKILKRFL